MSKEENVINYYLICNKLKQIIRSGWLVWNVKKERLESVAEHVFGVQMLALSMKSEFQYDVNIMKVIMMLAVHDLGEATIGDEIASLVSGINKKEREHKAVHEILKSLLDCEQIENLFLEYDAKETKEAKFAYWCDKLECDLQSKIYGQEGLVDLHNQSDNKLMKNNLVKKLLDEGYTWEDMWIKFGQTVYDYDQNFMSVSNYALNHGLVKQKK